MRFEEQTSQDVTQSLIRKITLVERLHHPVVEKIEFWIEEFVVRIE